MYTFFSIQRRTSQNNKKIKGKKSKKSTVLLCPAQRWYLGPGFGVSVIGVGLPLDIFPYVRYPDSITAIIHILNLVSSNPFK